MGGRKATNPVLRIFDANINRARERLRVIEDILRFVAGDRKLSGVVRGLRHRINRLALEICTQSGLIASRQAMNDVGASRWQEGMPRRNLSGLITANSRRATESMRVIEECTRLIGKPSLVRRIQAIRYEIYDVEGCAWRSIRVKKR